MLALFLIGGVGGLAATAAIDPNAVLVGAHGGALALLCAWATPDLLTLRAGGDVDGDLIGTAVIAVAVALMPLAVDTPAGSRTRSASSPGSPWASRWRSRRALTAGRGHV